jgi:hypothetical protein
MAGRKNADNAAAGDIVMMIGLESVELATRRIRKIRIH